MRKYIQFRFPFYFALIGIFLTSTAFGAGGDVTEGLTWGFEPTAVTLQNESFDIGKPVNGKIIDYVKQSAPLKSQTQKQAHWSLLQTDSSVFLEAKQSISKTMWWV